MAATVSAVIVNYNAGDIIRELVAALLTLPDMAQVVVVDNASADGSAARLADAIRDPRFQLIRNGVNRGFGAGCNQGAACAEAPYLLFINPDCRIEAGTLTRMLAALRARSDAGMAGPMILNADGSEQRGCRIRVAP